MINIEDFKKVELKVGKILLVEKVPETDKLLKLKVDLGLKKFPEGNFSPEPEAGVKALGEERDIRQIISGIALYYPDPAVLVGKKCMFVTNLEPRIIRGLESHGMILAISTKDGKFSLLEPNNEIPAGAKAK